MSGRGKPLPPPDTGDATSILSQRFSMDDDRDRPARRTRGEQTVGSKAVPVGEVAGNPRNTRNVSAKPRKIQRLAASISAIGQLHASPVVTREAFFAIFPAVEFEDEAKAIGNARYVQVSGARRRAAILYADLPTIDIEVKNDLAESREKFLEATLAENLDREDLDPIEEAHALAQMVAEAAGTVAAVARRRKRSDAWVFQRLNLLKLEPEVQDAFQVDDDPDDLSEDEKRAPRLPVREVRDWHKLDRAEQLAKLTAWRRRNDPTFVAEKPEPATAQDAKVKVSRIRATLLKLGETPVQMAQSIRAELSVEERHVLAEELLRDDPDGS